jgi:hypothetical protein
LDLDAEAAAAAAARTGAVEAGGAGEEDGLKTNFVAV